MIDLLSLIFPRYCCSCDKELALKNKPLCSECSRAFIKISSPWCRRCGRPAQAETPACGWCLSQENPTIGLIDQMRSLLVYNGVSGGLIRAFKLKREHSLINWFVDQIETSLREELFKGITHIVPVPLSRGSFKERLFNQTMLLALKLSRMSGIPVLSLLEKVRETASQRTLKEQQRRRNLKGAFQVRTGKLKDVEKAHLLLVDDVLTSGATLGECAQTLKKAGFSHIEAFTLTRRM